MYIYPNTTVKILHNVSLNNDYDHTIYFASEQAQRTFFDNVNRVKYTLNNQQYQRKERGWMQVNLNQNQLWDCTYLMFQNTHYTLAPSGSIGTSYKWFYAFILNVEYVNENVSKINFEIDEIQTWMFDYVLDKCFVEREHTLTDNLYENTVEEGLDLGNEYWVQKNYKYDFDCTRIAIVESGYWNRTEDKFTAYAPTKMGNYLTGLHYQCYDLKDTDTTDPNYPNSSSVMYAHIQDYITHGIEDAIVSIYQYPRFMGRIPTSGDGDYNYVYTDITFSPNLTTIGGYTPKNKKLFCYPYNFIEIDDCCGNTAEYKLEQWYPNEHTGEFRIWGTPFGIPTCLCFPRFYDGEQQNIQRGLSIQFDVQNPWVGDAYSIWLAKNQKNYLMENAINGVRLVTGFVANSPDAMIRGSVNISENILNKIRRKNELEATPGTVHGHTVNSLLNLQATNNGLIFRQKAIKAEFAKIIDEYFSRFGYACNRIKVPNTNARQNWTYTKTVGCEIVGNLPSDSIAKIKQIYDHGITFWNDGLNVGNYGDFSNPIYA